jgi:UDP-glucose 4-epimerase
MNVCITGALGHIGSYLLRHLSVPGLEKIHLVDNFLTQRYCSLFDLPDKKNFIFHNVDITSDEIEPIIEDSDVLISLAAITDAPSSFEHEEDVERVNKKGLERLATLCAKHGTSVIFPSTTSVYGSQEKVVDETCRELRPQSPYAESKLWGEKKLISLGEKKNLKFVIFRFGTIFGYSIGMRFHTAVNKFIWQASLGEKITVWKTALYQRRPYLGLGDCVRAINHAIENYIFDCQIYNIVTINLRVKDVVDEITKYIPDVKLEFVDSPVMNQLSYNVSNKKSLKKGFSYQDSLDGAVCESIFQLRNANSLVPKRKL